MSVLEIVVVIGLSWVAAIALFAWAWAKFNAPFREPVDPEIERLKAERAKPLRQRRTYRAIDRDMQAIINARLAGGR